MNACVSAVREQGECPDDCDTGYIGPFCPAHQPIKHHRWAVSTPQSTEFGEAPSNAEAWARVHAVDAQHA